MSFSSISAFFDQLEFITGWLFILLPLPFLVRLFIKPAAKQEIALLAPTIMQRLNTGNQPKIEANVKQHNLPIIYLILWILVVIAASRPALFVEPTSFNTTGKDMILAVDLSGSMEKPDMRVSGQKVNRLVAVKYVVQDFIKQREGDRLGLVVFGSQAFIQSPLTYDLQTVNQLLHESEIGMAGNNTAIGDAIGITLKHLANTHQKKTVLILLTDGSNTAGVVSPIDAAEQAKKFGLKIYTIGIGQTNLSNIEAFLNSGHSMDIASLKKIASVSGGQFYLASNTQQLNNIYEEINHLEQSKHQVHQYRLRTELYHYPLGFAFLLSLFIAGYRLWGQA
jgi:Ca-activated chloride channel family protein